MEKISLIAMQLIAIPRTLKIIPWRYKFNSINRIRVDKLSFFTRTSLPFTTNSTYGFFRSYHTYCNWFGPFSNFYNHQPIRFRRRVWLLPCIVLVFASKIPIYTFELHKYTTQQQNCIEAILCVQRKTNKKVICSAHVSKRWKLNEEKIYTHLSLSFRLLGIYASFFCVHASVNFLFSSFLS